MTTYYAMIVDMRTEYSTRTYVKGTRKQIIDFVQEFRFFMEEVFIMRVHGNSDFAYEARHNATDVTTFNFDVTFGYLHDVIQRHIDNDTASLILNHKINNRVTVYCFHFARHEVIETTKLNKVLSILKKGGLYPMAITKRVDCSGKFRD